MEPSVPYSIKESDVLGRYLIANRDFERGEIIFEEYPLLTGLSSDDRDPKVTCLECYKETDSKCDGCGFPICDVHDAQLPHQHTTSECNLLQRTKQLFGSINQTEPIHSKIMALICGQLYFIRCLLLDPDAEAKFKLLSTNIDDWRQSQLAEEFKNQLDLLARLFGTILEFPSDEDLCQVKARLDTNAYEIRLPTGSVLGVYSLASLLEHSCLPNTYRSARSTDLKLTIRAAQTIAKGSHLSMSYVDLMATTSQRQQELQATKFFTCVCPRCQDPSECGSFLSALLCPTCSTGKDYPMLPLFAEGEDTSIVQAYSCGTCGLVKHHEEVEQVLDRAGKEWETIDSILEDEEEDIEKDVAIQLLVDWLKKWTSSKFLDNLKLPEFAWCKSALVPAKDPELLQLHPHNSVVFNACHSVLFILSIPKEMDEDDLRFKIAIGRHLLKIITPITPEFQSLRCMVMFLLGEAQLTSYASDLSSESKNSIPFEERKAQVDRSCEMSHHGIEFMSYEPEDSSEGTFYKRRISKFNELAKRLKSFYE